MGARTSAGGPPVADNGTVEQESVPVIRPVDGGTAKLMPDVDRPRGTVSVPVNGGVRLLTEVIAALDADGIALTDIGLRRPTLDEVFLALTEDTPRDTGRAAVGAGAPSEKE